MILIEPLTQLPPALNVLLLSMLPIAELRGAIPVAVWVYHFNIFHAYLLAVVANMVPAIFVLWLFDPVQQWLSKRFTFFQKFFEWLFERTRNKFADKYQKWGELALLLFVAIPLPVTGVWTGSLAAVLFGFKKQRALVLLAGGAAVAGVIVSLATLGLITIF